MERIDYDAETDTFTFYKAATLDLVGGHDLTAWEAEADSTLPDCRVSGAYHNFQTIHTPSGALKEGPVRPHNVVVCRRPTSPISRFAARLDLSATGNPEPAASVSPELKPGAQQDP